MTRRALVGPVALVLAAAVLPASAGEVVRHELTVELDPATHRLAVRDTLVLPPGLGDEAGLEFLLNAALTLRESEPAAEAAPGVEAAQKLTINGAPSERGAEATVRRYRLSRVPEGGRVTLVYDGAFDFGLSDAKEEYTRGFRETIGVVGPEGVYLAAGSFWYPYLGDDLVEFTLEVVQPEGWHVVSEGSGTSRGEDGRARWVSDAPTDEIHLTGGALVRYADTAGAVEALVYLRESDAALAAKYLEATAQYLEMYRGLIGPYPYDKFALVENFWETGYGMPSFTLLGPRVIRFPFILHSSYPHEILHNWWGNGVFVDFATGNWCEGLTAYMADHLIQEQRGRGAAYRRDTLQKYRNYVRGERDFPLEEFRSRHSASTEAVGYGKSLMGFHMLRRRLGDDAFRTALARFYRGQRGKQASFRDLQAAFEAAGRTDLRTFFDQWLRRTGAPAFEVEVDRVARDDEGWTVAGRLIQGGGDEPFALEVPVVLDSREGATTHVVATDGRETRFELRAATEPLLLRVDPEFDLFRMLDPRETPPSIGQIFGEPRIVAVLPAAAGPEALARYRALVEGWRSESHAIETVLDAEVERLPAERAVWVVGRENRHVATLFGGGAVDGLDLSKNAVVLAGENSPLDGHSVVAIRRHPDDPDRAVGWLAVDPPAAFEGLGRKLPHYGKYSYLTFAGDEPENVIKGQWPASDSPLVVDLRPSGRRAGPSVAAELPSRAALAELPPVFSENALARHVTYLASPELEGRGIGSAGLDRAADYVAARFAAAGLAPGASQGSYLQTFVVDQGPDGRPVETANVIGVLPGAREAWRGQAVVLAAHYDHLGLGWPDAHAGDEGRVHPGADDNASGVAVLLELAAAFASGEAPSRTLVFIAFSGEEAGRLGSRHWVEHPSPVAIEGVRAAINLDTVGRLRDGRISVFATGTADEWPHVFRGVGFVTGIDSRNVADSVDASDHVSFIEAGVPAVQIFAEAHADYHRPSDTADKVDAAGLVKVATFVKEATAYLLEREEPLTSTLAGRGSEPSGSGAPSSPGGGRKVSFGTVPEFGFAGPGVQVASLVPGSPAEQAGIRPGDVLVRIDAREVADLRAFSEILKGLEPGQTVEATVLREGRETSLRVTLVER